jgi:hypothetical protein
VAVWTDLFEPSLLQKIRLRDNMKISHLMAKVAKRLRISGERLRFADTITNVNYDPSAEINSWQSQRLFHCLIK